MREVVFRNLSSASSRKKDVFLKEVFERDGVTARTERRCFYYIKEITNLENREDLQHWLDGQNQVGTVSRRQFYIFREHNDKLGEDRMLCKILGTFYVIVDNAVYTIAFLHSFRVVFSRNAFSK